MKNIDPPIPNTVKKGTISLFLHNIIIYVTQLRLEDKLGINIGDGRNIVYRKVYFYFLL